MNRIYRLVWNDLSRTWVAVAEIVRGRGKRGSTTVGHAPSLRRPAGIHGPRVLAVSLAFIGVPAWALDAGALPTGGTVTAGSATISQTANVLTVQQSSQRVALDWQTFNIGAAATVNFIQPSSSSVALNRIVGNEASQIYGKLNANGQVFFINPNGMLFARGAEVNVGGILATTLNLGNEDFMAGNYRFTNPGAGSLRNEGLINALGSVALIGNTVQNSGQIIATSVTLAAGNTVAVDLTSDGLIRARVEDAALKASIENSGSIDTTVAVTLTTGQAKGMLDRVVNNSGVIRATGLAIKNGEITLEAATVDNSGTIVASSTKGGGTIKLMGDMDAGTVKVGGTLDASASGSGNGGFIETSAAHVDIAGDLKVTTASAMGLTGTWLIDPVDYTIAASGGNMTGAALTTSLASTNVTIFSTNGTVGTAGDVNVNDVVAWSANKLTLNAQNNININANMTATSTASLALEYGQGAVASGNTSNIITKGASVSLPASTTNFTTKQGSDGAVKNYTVITSLGAAGSATGTDLQGMQGNLSGNYALGADINASATSGWNSGAGFAPVDVFSGVLNGLGHVISGLTINRTTHGIGLFGTSSGVIQNVGLTAANIAVGDNTQVGGLAGSNMGTISNSYVTGQVSAGSGGVLRWWVGGNKL